MQSYIEIWISCIASNLDFDLQFYDIKILIKSHRFILNIYFLIKLFFLYITMYVYLTFIIFNNLNI